MTPGGEGLTFDGNVDALADGKLRLDEHTAQVLALIHAFLHVGQLESPVLKHHLAVVIRQQQGVLVPLDGVVGVADDPAVDECVPPSDGGDVPHGPDAGGSWGVWGKVERRGRWRHEPVPFCGGALLSCLSLSLTPGARNRVRAEGGLSVKFRDCQDWGHPCDPRAHCCHCEIVANRHKPHMFITRIQSLMRLDEANPQPLQGTTTTGPGVSLFREKLGLGCQ